MACTLHRFEGLSWGLLEPHWQDIQRAGNAEGFVSPQPMLSWWPSPLTSKEKHFEVYLILPSSFTGWTWILHETWPGITPLLHLCSLNSLVTFSWVSSVNHLDSNPQLKICLCGTQLMTLNKLFLGKNCPWKVRHFLFAYYENKVMGVKFALCMFYQTSHMHQRFINRMGILE